MSSLSLSRVYEDPHNIIASLHVPWYAAIICRFSFISLGMDAVMLVIDCAVDALKSKIPPAFLSLFCRNVAEDKELWVTYVLQYL